MNNVGPSSQPTYTELAEAVEKVALTSLPKKERAQPGWFRANANKLLPLFDARNQAMGEVFNRRTRAYTKRLQLARQKQKSAVKRKLRSKNFSLKKYPLDMYLSKNVNSLKKINLKGKKTLENMHTVAAIKLY